MESIETKIATLGGIQNIYPNNYHDIDISKHLINIKNTMHDLPQKEIIDFSKLYGFSAFKRQVYINAIENSTFLEDGKVEVGTIYGFGGESYSVIDIINKYYKEDQLNYSFYPIIEGYPGDIVFYSLKKETFGMIFYWHHESNIGDDITLISNSFSEFINNLYYDEDDIKSEALSYDELIVVNEKRKRFGLPPIDKYKNLIHNTSN